MNRVFIELVPPDAVWAKEEPEVKKGLVRYVAKFCKESKLSNPVHVGATVNVVVVNDKGEELSRRAATLIIKGNGDIMVRSYEAAVSALEKG